MRLPFWLSAGQILRPLNLIFSLILRKYGMGVIDENAGRTMLSIN